LDEGIIAIDPSDQSSVPEEDQAPVPEINPDQERDK
jgi:hypothetical protein